MLAAKKQLQLAFSLCRSRLCARINHLSHLKFGSIAITAILMIALAAGFFGVVFGNRFGVQSPDAEAVLLLSSVLCILSLPLFITLTSGI